MRKPLAANPSQAAIEKTVCDVLRDYLAADPTGHETGSVVGRAVMQGNLLKSATTLHAGAVQALALVEAAQIHASALDRLSAAIRATVPKRKPQCKRQG